MKKNLLSNSIFNEKSPFGFKIASAGIDNGYIKEKYGKYGSDNIKGMPSLSLPLEWKNFPKETKSFALIMEDYDAIPVTGFSWIHWTAIIPGNITKLEENDSLTNKNIIQGVNSWVSSMGGLSISEASHFGGPAPPDKDHTYKIIIYALDTELKLDNGYYLNQLYKEMRGHIIDCATIEGIYKV